MKNKKRERERERERERNAMLAVMDGKKKKNSVVVSNYNQ